MAGDVVITGVGVVSPVGCGEVAFWDALRGGRSAAAPVEGLDTSDLSRTIACQVRTPLEVTGAMGRAAKLAITATRQATQQAGLSAADFAASHDTRLSVLIGTTMGETEFIEERLSQPDEQWLTDEHVRRIAVGKPGSIARRVRADFLATDLLMSDSPVSDPPAAAPSPDRPQGAADRPDSLSSPLNKGGKRGVSPQDKTTSSPEHQAVSNLNAGAVTAGCSMDLYGACAAGNLALAAARRQLLDGRCDVAIAGGADGFSHLAFIGFMRLRAMSSGVCRPFDEQRDGLLVGEGAAIFVLERESTARARGATIRGYILGAGVTCESYHPTRPHPEGDGLTRATQAALADANLTPTDIDYVCAHGTGTPQNDAIEVAVLDRCFPQGVAFSSIKALTGHTMGAAAAMEAVACLLSLEHQTLIPTWHLDNVLQPCSSDAVRGSVRLADVRYTVNNSAGFGGYNSSVVIAAA